MDTPEAVQPSENAPGAIAMPAAGILEHVYKPEARPASSRDVCAVCGGQLAARQHALCAWDGCAHLIHPQKRYASARCCAAHHDRLHPRINPPGLGLRDQGSIKERIRKHLLGLEGRHATTLEIAAAIQERESTTARELRKLKRRGCPVQMARLNGPSSPAVFWISKDAA